jgi:dihydroorotase-like cyclic amidohydrolase
VLLLEHTHSGPVRSPADLAEKARHLAGRSHMDFGLGAHAWPGEAEQARAVREAGASFVKAFTCTTPGVPGHDPAQLQQLLAAAARIGATCLLHCEDESPTAAAERAPRAAHRADGAVIPAWRNRAPGPRPPPWRRSWPRGRRQGGASRANDSDRHGLLELP